MKIVIVGNDLRTIALAKKLLAEGHSVAAVPGCQRGHLPGLISVPLPDEKRYEFAWQQVRRIGDLIVEVEKLNPDLVVCLHIESSDAGLVDALLAHAGRRYPVFGVSRESSRLETSKIYGLSIAQQSALRVPVTEIVRQHERDQWIARQYSLPNRKLVVKADGLAGGRGTMFVNSGAELESAFKSSQEGDLLIQEHVHGQEVALSLMCVGNRVELLNVNFEYKRAHDGDTGPNTPGMGTVARNGVDLGWAKAVLKGLPESLRALGYVGPLDVSFILDEVRREPVFMEFTARFGDPELSSELLLMNNVSQLLTDVASGVNFKVDFKPYKWAAGVIARGGAHPGVSEESQESFSQESIDEAGGSYTCFSAAGDSLQLTLKRVYEAIKNTASPESIWRSDIGHDTQLRWQSFKNYCGQGRRRSGRAKKRKAGSFGNCLHAQPLGRS